MKKTFEGVFRRFEENPSPLIPQELIDLAKEHGAQAEFDKIPQHERVKTSGAALAVLRDIAEQASFLTSRESGAGMKLGFTIEENTIRLNVEIQSQEAALLAQAEKEIKRMIENHRGTFADISSARGKA